MNKIDLTLPEFCLVLDYYFSSNNLKNKFTVEGKEVIYKSLDEDLDMIWTTEQIVNEYTELPIIEFAKKFNVESDEDIIESYLYQEDSYPLGFTQDTVVFQDVLK